MPDIEALIAQLTLEEKVLLCAGADTWRTAAIPRLGIPAIKVTDGPNGARGAGFTGTTSACFPCGTALGATWDPELVREVGAALGEEARSKGARVLLAPTLNIHRHPLAGRNFECPSEDPSLAAAYAKAYVEGVQSRGVAATAKHFVCNDQEYQRMTISAEVGERALREIYLPPFEAAVREAGAWALMTAYNRINGIYASEHAALLRGLLEGEWGFDGLVMSDWGGTHSAAEAANAGLDLEMPGPAVWFGERLREAVASGQVAESVLDEKVRRLLRLAVRTGAFDDPEEPPERSVDDPAHRALIRRAARDGMVLLRNDGVLPLDPTRAGLIAVIGPNGDTLTALGGGSARVEPHHLVQPLDAIRERVAGAAEVRFEPGCRIDRGTPPLGRGLTTAGPAGPVPGATVEYFDNPDFAGEPVLTHTAPRLQLTWLGQFHGGRISGQFSVRARGTFTPEESGVHRFTLTSAGLSRLLLDGELLVDNWTQQTRGTTFFGRGSAEVGASIELRAGEPHELVVEFQSRPRAGIAGVNAGCLPPEPPDLMERAVALAARAETVVVVAGLTAEWESEGFDRASMALPGRQDELIRRVAAAHPRTIVVINAGSPVSMPWAEDVAAVLQAWYPGQEGGDAIADVLFGAVDPGGRLPTSFPYRVEDCTADLTYPGDAGSVVYGEGMFVGYRGYDRRKLAPRYPFGHGLSYTTFALGPLKLSRDAIGPNEGVDVTVPVRNTGERAGRTVVQLYVRDVESSLLRPEKELKGFAKLTLAPGEEREARITLGPRAFAAWDPSQHAWRAEPGEFEILAGFSAADLPVSATLRLVEE